MPASFGDIGMAEDAFDRFMGHWVALALLPDAVGRDHDLARAVRRNPAMADHLMGVQASWRADERRAFQRIEREPPSPSRSALAAGRASDLFGTDTARVRCLRLAKDVEAGDVPRGERDWVRAALRDHADPLMRSYVSRITAPPPYPPSPAGPVTFAFPRPVAGRGGTLAARSEGVAVVREVDPADAPLACRLARPGGHLDVRSYAGGLVRPVLSPGSWEPMGMAGFAAAAAEGPAWVDNPFAERPADGAVAIGLRDYAMAGPPAGASARAKDAAMAEAALLRAGPLYLIGGVVHRTAPAPVLGLAHRYLARGRGKREERRVDDASDGALATWWMGGLHMLENQGTMRPTHWDVDHGLWFPTMDGLPCVHGTPADAASLASMVGKSPSHGPWIDGDPVAVDVDPAAFPDDGRFALRTLARGGWPLAPDARALVAAALDGNGDAAALRELGEGAGDWNLGRNFATRAVEVLLGMAAPEVEAMDPWVSAGMPGL